MVHQSRVVAVAALLQILIPSIASSQIPLRISQDYSANSHTQDYKFDPLLHLPGISPYFDAIGSGLNHRAPDGCEVTAASYLIRHAAIYANDDDYELYIEPFLKKLDSTYSSTLTGKKRKGWSGPLKFFEKWQTPIDDPENQLEKITPQGVKDSKKVAKHLYSRYPDLVPTAKRIYADKKSRTQDTAAAFAEVFPQDIELVEMRKNRTSFHSQVPHKSCKAFTKEPGNDEQQEFLAHYAPLTIARLQPYSPVQLENYDIMGLQQLCGYESAIRGKISKICNVFTDAEWMAYEYSWDMKYSRMFHAPRHTESEIPDDDGQRFFLSFTHREVPPFIATALGLFNSSNAFAEEFPTNRINWSRSWRMAELIPFLGHVGIEKLTCRGLTGDDEKEEEFVRIIANTAPRPIPNCQGGPGASCAFHDFENIVRKGMDKYGDFDGICGNDK
ncbi:hypothetical protein CJF30_00010225 [Rutstroemia sp. NJR-2017a BBW]|nr:hypothetical protein CJF30_00010225 [Rutstroemia sp. NJR-2017a BBW]